MEVIEKDVFTVLKDIIADKIEDGIDIELDSKAVDLGLDSLGMLEMVCEVEEEFDVEFTDDIDMSQLTLGDVVEIVENQRKGE